MRQTKRRKFCPFHVLTFLSCFSVDEPSQLKGPDKEACERQPSGRGVHSQQDITGGKTVAKSKTANDQAGYLGTDT